MNQRRDVPLKELITFELEGLAPVVFDVQTIDELVSVKRDNPHAIILGKGSNTLLNPNDAIPPIIRLSQECVATTRKGNALTISAGTSINRMTRLCMEHELSGLEFAAGVPATLGGMVTMNFGCWGEEIAQRLQNAYVLTAENDTIWVTCDELEMSYRNSAIKRNNWVVLAATLALSPTSKDKVQQATQAAIDKRLDKQPLRAPTFGSTFKNPTGQFAGAIIEELGYKGTPHGNVKMSDKHANFMINTGHATFEQAKSLIEAIKKDAKTQKNITLECEVHIVP
ncbi:MAG: UDP-N-acetylmuramate dehydrogenase [bacterium]|nr:UDP-N-acetylmuramate dehydrogenase [bacterium]